LLDAWEVVDGADPTLRERVAALKHDLGKYVAWASANLAEADWTGPVGPALLSALHRDLLSTRTRGGVDEPAWEVWARLTADLPRPLEVPELAVCEACVAELRAAEAPLRANDAAALAGLRERVRRAQTQIRRELSALSRRVSKA
jgi:hypothetical protein